MSVPFIALDGTFLINCFKKTLLTATGRTANGKIILLAWAVVESENTSSWDWFLSFLLTTLPTLGKEPESPHCKICVASDRDKGLKAAESCLKHCTIINCCWHLMNNVIKTSQAINKGLIKEAWWRFPYIRNQFEWDKAIEKLQEVGGQVNIILYLKYYMLILFLQAAVNYVEALDKSTFTAWKVKGPRYGHTTSSTAGSTNSAIQD
jgi:hypothetical protein